ncbi:hypothetical protein D3C86_1830310 [compost metagenome]
MRRPGRSGVSRDSFSSHTVMNERSITCRPISSSSSNVFNAFAARPMPFTGSSPGRQRFSSGCISRSAAVSLINASIEGK